MRSFKDRLLRTHYKAIAKLFFILLCLNLQCSLPKRLENYSIERRLLFLYHFTNQSYAAGINHKLGLALRKEISRRANFRLSEKPKEAYLWLQGQISSYQKRPRFYSYSRESGHYELLALCRVRLRENPDKAKSEDARLLLSQELGARVSFSDKGAYVETEEQALKRLFYILALRINQVIEKAYVDGHELP